MKYCITLLQYSKIKDKVREDLIYNKSTSHHCTKSINNDESKNMCMINRTNYKT